jgi:hypothetical protein
LTASSFSFLVFFPGRCSNNDSGGRRGFTERQTGSWKIFACVNWFLPQQQFDSHYKKHTSLFAPCTTVMPPLSVMF